MQAQREEDFKNSIFIANPELYFKLWPLDGTEAVDDDDGVEEIIPETPEDVQEMIQEFQKWAGT